MPGGVAPPHCRDKYIRTEHICLPVVPRLCLFRVIKKQRSGDGGALVMCLHSLCSHIIFEFHPDICIQPPDSNQFIIILRFSGIVPEASVISGAHLHNGGEAPECQPAHGCFSRESTPVATNV